MNLKRVLFILGATFIVIRECHVRRSDRLPVKWQMLIPSWQDSCNTIPELRLVSKVDVSEVRHLDGKHVRWVLGEDVFPDQTSASRVPE